MWKMLFKYITGSSYSMWKILFKYNKWVINLEIIKVFSCLELAKSFLDNMEQTITHSAYRNISGKKEKI